jgi:hypothetical protein
MHVFLVVKYYLHNSVFITIIFYYYYIRKFKKNCLQEQKGPKRLFVRYEKRKN